MDNGHGVPKAFNNVSENYVPKNIIHGVQRAINIKT